MIILPVLDGHPPLNVLLTTPAKTVTSRTRASDSITLSDREIEAARSATIRNQGPSSAGPTAENPKCSNAKQHHVFHFFDGWAVLPKNSKDHGWIEAVPGSPKETLIIKLSFPQKYRLPSRQHEAKDTGDDDGL
jgi:hypothetical protein